MKTVVILVCGILLLGSGVPAMALDLPPDVLADQYLLEATEALEQGDPQTALWHLSKSKFWTPSRRRSFCFFTASCWWSTVRQWRTYGRARVCSNNL